MFVQIAKMQGYSVDAEGDVRELDQLLMATVMHSGGGYV